MRKYRNPGRGVNNVAPRSFRTAFKEAKNRPAYWAENALLAFVSRIDRLLRERDVSRADFARRLGKSPAYISKLMRGDQNLTHESMAEIAHALDCRLAIVLIPNMSRGETPTRVWVHAIPDAHRIEYFRENLSQLPSARFGVGVTYKDAGTNHPANDGNLLDTQVA
jgi:transcriptional regulator with XRE-family HTH domain